MVSQDTAPFIIVKSGNLSTEVYYMLMINLHITINSTARGSEWIREITRTFFES